MTYGELKAVLDGLTAEQLAMKVRWCGDERGGVIESVEITSEDWANFGEGLEPLSNYGDAPPLDEEVSRMPAGSPLLMTDEGGR